MKTKFLMFVMAIGMLLAAPSLSYAQLTDDDLDFLGNDGGGSEFGPVSLYSPIQGTLSHQNETITLNFDYDMGIVTVWIVDENNNICMTQEVNSANATKTPIDIKVLSDKKYSIICFTPEGQFKANFELYK